MVKYQTNHVRNNPKYKIKKVPRDIQGEKSGKDTASSGHWS